MNALELVHYAAERTGLDVTIETKPRESGLSWSEVIIRLGDKYAVHDLLEEGRSMDEFIVSAVFDLVELYHRPPTFTEAEIDAIEHLHPDPRETIENAEEMHELRDSVLEKMRELRSEEAP